MDLEYT